MKSGRRCLWAFWAALLLLGAFLFVFRITHESLWMDEAFSVAVADLPFSDFWRVSVQENSPPLYYFMLWIFRRVFGDSFLAARLFSAMGAFWLVLLGIGPIRRACGDRVGIVYTAVAIFTPILIVHAQEVRMYGWAAFFVTGMAVYAYLAVSEGKRLGWLKFGVFTVAAMYTHLYSLMAAFFAGLFSFIWLFLRDRKKLPAFLVAVGIPVLLFVPWMFVLFGRISQVSQEFWIPEVTEEVIVQAICGFFGLKFTHDDQSYQAMTVIASLIAAVGIVIAFAKEQKERFLLALSVYTFLATLLTGVVISDLVRPLLIARYMVPLLGLSIIALAYGIAQFPRRLAVAVCIVFVFCQVSTIRDIHWERFNGPMDEVAEYLDANTGQDDVFIHFDEHTLHTFAVYVPDYLHVMYLPPEATVYAPSEVHGDKVKVVSSLGEVELDNRRVWLAQRIGGGNVPQYNQVARELGVRPVPMGQERLYSVIHSEQAEFFWIPTSWYAVVLHPVPSKP